MIQTSPTITFIDERSKEIYEKKEHAVITISPFNSYYNEQRIEQIIEWTVKESFKTFHIFTGDGLWVYNFLALGYSEKEALQKTKKEDSFLHRRIKRVLDKWSISHIVILDYQSFKENIFYNEQVQKYKKLIKTDFELQTILSKIVENMNVQKFRNVSLVDKEMAFNYFLEEMPVLLNSPELFQVNSSCFIYHQNNMMYHYLYLMKKMQACNQGFINLKFD